MKIGFVGCGAIGSCYASILSKKHEVCVLDTYGPYLLGKLTNRCPAVGVNPQPVGN